MAYSAKHMNVNQIFGAEDYYVRLISIDSSNYRYKSPEGKFARQEIPIGTDIDSTNLCIHKVSSIHVQAAKVPIVMDKALASVLKVGDEILLAVNGKIFPDDDPAHKSFTVLEVNPTDQKPTLIVLKVFSEHVADSLWLVKATDHIVPIILRSMTSINCGKKERPVVIFDSVTYEPRYVCRALKKNSVRKPRANCPCDSVSRN